MQTLIPIVLKETEMILVNKIETPDSTYLKRRKVAVNVFHHQVGDVKLKNEGIDDTANMKPDVLEIEMVIEVDTVMKETGNKNRIEDVQVEMDIEAVDTLTWKMTKNTDVNEMMIVTTVHTEEKTIPIVPGKATIYQTTTTNQIKKNYGVIIWMKKILNLQNQTKNTPDEVRN